MSVPFDVNYQVVADYSADTLKAGQKSGTMQLTVHNVFDVSRGKFWRIRFNGMDKTGIIECTLFEPHSSQLTPRIKPGAVVLLKNAKVTAIDVGYRSGLRSDCALTAFKEAAVEVLTDNPPKIIQGCMPLYEILKVTPMDFITIAGVIESITTDKEFKQQNNEEPRVQNWTLAIVTDNEYDIPVIFLDGDFECNKLTINMACVFENLQVRKGFGCDYQLDFVSGVSLVKSRVI